MCQLRARGLGFVFGDSRGGDVFFQSLGRGSFLRLVCSTLCYCKFPAAQSLCAVDNGKGDCWVEALKLKP